MCALKSERPNALSLDDAETIAISAIAFLAEDQRRMERFLALTGMDPQTLIAGAETPPVQVAVLDHLLGDESLLMVFVSVKGLLPEAVPAARALLDGVKR
jgi:hypothetical protein